MATARVALAELRAAGDLVPDSAAGVAAPVSAELVAEGTRGTLVAFYFGAAWCGPCQAFSPVLAQFARSRAAADALQVVFVSADRTAAAAQSFARGKGFLSVPFDSDARSSLPKVLKVNSFPTLIVVDTRGDGRIVTRWGRAAISSERREGDVVRGWLDGRGLSAWTVAGPMVRLGVCLALAAALVWLVRYVRS
jgi:nucleoredoxin